MNESYTPQNSVIESDHSRSSEVALIGNLFSKAECCDITSRDRKYSRKYNVTKDHIEEDGNYFKWIPNSTELSEELKKTSQKASPTHAGTSMFTMESDRTSSSCTASDFTGNVHSKNGYIRGTSDKRCTKESNPMFKYNEFSSLISSLGTGRNFPVEIKLENDGKKEEKRPCLDGEHSIYLILGGIQMMLGILMAVFGVLVLAHDSSLSNSGSGLWGGAVAMFTGCRVAFLGAINVIFEGCTLTMCFVYWAVILTNGLTGILAGFRGCYSNKKHIKVSRTILTIFLALCLVSFALSNLVVVLTVTGLIRDIQRPKSRPTEDASEENYTNWPSILADVGLILGAGLQCVAAVFSGYKCYKKVCPCLKGSHSRLSETESHNEKYKSDSKERLVNQWLGQQFRMPNKKNKCENQNNLMPWGTPNIMLLPPPPPMITNGQIPILTFLQAPSSVFGSGSAYPPNSLPCCCRHETRYLTTPHPMVHGRRVSRKFNYIQPDTNDLTKKRNRSKKIERRSSLPTAEEVARTYTGLDREIAEEFIAIAMDKGRISRHNSFAEFANNY